MTYCERALPLMAGALFAFLERANLTDQTAFFLIHRALNAAAGTRYNRTKGHFRYFSEYHESAVKRMQDKTIEDLVSIINQGVMVYFPDRKVYEGIRPHWRSRKTVIRVLEYTPKPIFCTMEAAIMQVAGLLLPAAEGRMNLRAGL